MFIKEGTDPDGPSGMYVPSCYAEYGKPDAYFDLDDIEMQPLELCIESDAVTLDNHML